MYAIIKTGGKQIKVEEGQTVYIEKLAAEAGETVTFEDVLFVGGDNTMTALTAPNTTAVTPAQTRSCPCSAKFAWPVISKDNMPLS